MNCTLHIDGGARGNPGPAGVGVVLRCADDNRPLHEAGYFLGTATNNVAEYRGLIRGLEVAGKLGADPLHIHSDSELMVKQIKGEYRVKSADLKPLYERAKALLGKHDGWKITHVRREKNQRADELANLAMDARRNVVVIGEGAEANAAEVPSSSSPSDAPPCWTAELTGAKSRCVVGQSTGNAYTFGPTTPEGFCVYAAAAALNDGPLAWPQSKRTADARCRQCGQTVRLTRLT